jgi:hypothetical protein
MMKRTVALSIVVFKSGFGHKTQKNPNVNNQPVPDHVGRISEGSLNGNVSALPASIEEKFG